MLKNQQNGDQRQSNHVESNLIYIKLTREEVRHIRTSCTFSRGEKLKSYSPRTSVERSVTHRLLTYLLYIHPRMK